MKILLSLLTAATVGAAHATSISLSDAPLGRSVLDADSLALADGSLVLVGTFSDISLLANLPAADLATAAGWTQFGSALAIGSVFGNPGKLIGTTTDVSAAAAEFDGEPIYLWIFNGPTIESSTEYGVFTAPGGVPEWTFPTNAGGIGDLLTLSADDGSLSAVGSLGAVDAEHLTLVPISSVPEPAPAVYGLLGIGVAMLCLRRAAGRRRRA